MQPSTLIRSRLTDSLCPGVALRPQLEAARAKLSTLLCNTVEKAGANSSYLLIGARGTGKSLVRLSELKESHQSDYGHNMGWVYNRMRESMMPLRIIVEPMMLVDDLTIWC